MLLFFRRPGVLATTLLGALLPLHAQYTGPAAGEKVAFLGDSITQYGWDQPGGYVHLVDRALDQEGHKIVVIPAGISGNTSKDMLGRFTSDVLAKKPDWMLMSCGVNDVWHGENGIPLDQYKINITSMVDQAKAAGIKVVILASTPIGQGKPTDGNNLKLATYNDFLRSLASQDNLPFVDLYAAMNQGFEDESKKAHHQGDNITVDGVHPNIIGYEIMATAILKTWGVTDAQIDDMTLKWEAIPGGMSYNGMQFDNNSGISLHDYLTLRATAELQGKSVKEVLADIVKQGIAKRIAGNPSADSIDAKP